MLIEWVCWRERAGPQGPPGSASSVFRGGEAFLFFCVSGQIGLEDGKISRNYESSDASPSDGKKQRVQSRCENESSNMLERAAPPRCAAPLGQVNAQNEGICFRFSHFAFLIPLGAS